MDYLIPFILLFTILSPLIVPWMVGARKRCMRKIHGRVQFFFFVMLTGPISGFIGAALLTPIMIMDLGDAAEGLAEFFLFMVGTGAFFSIFT